MKTQLIKIGPDGSMQSLNVKTGRGIDLRQFGQANIVRSSLIEWSTDAQMWYIQLLHGPHAGILTDQVIIHIAGLDILDLKADGWGDVVVHESLTPHFKDYDAAVEAEILVIQALRLKGVEV